MLLVLLARAIARDRARRYIRLSSPTVIRDYLEGPVLVNVFRDGVRSASDEPLLTGVSTIPKGQKIEGVFPLLMVN